MRAFTSPKSAAPTEPPPAARSRAWAIAQAALIRPMRLNAGGELPIISPPVAPISSASKPTSLIACMARSKVALACSSFGLGRYLAVCCQLVPGATGAHRVSFLLLRCGKDRKIRRHAGPVVMLPQRRLASLG
jgi:hypothetical protein